jgi:tyrosyl-tRNA synthetase
MSISDALMWRYIELLSFEPMATVRQWQREVSEGRNPRDVKALFAREIVARFHGRTAAEDAERDFEQRFRHGALPAEMPSVTLECGSEDGIAVAHAATASGLTPSHSESFRMIEQGGVKLDGARVSDRAARIARGATVVLQVGKRRFARVTVR